MILVAHKKSNALANLASNMRLTIIGQPSAKESLKNLDNEYILSFIETMLKQIKSAEPNKKTKKTPNKNTYNLIGKIRAICILADTLNEKKYKSLALNKIRENILAAIFNSKENINLDKVCFALNKQIHSLLTDSKNADTAGIDKYARQYNQYLIKHLSGYKQSVLDATGFDILPTEQTEPKPTLKPSSAMIVLDLTNIQITMTLLRSVAESGLPVVLLNGKSQDLDDGTVAIQISTWLTMLGGTSAIPIALEDGNININQILAIASQIFEDKKTMIFLSSNEEQVNAASDSSSAAMTVDLQTQAKPVNKLIKKTTNSSGIASKLGESMQKVTQHGNNKNSSSSSSSSTLTHSNSSNSDDSN